MTCPQVRELLPEYALGALDGPDRDAVEQHLAAGCPECVGALAETRAMLARLPASLPPAPPSGEALTRLMDRLRSAPDRDHMPTPAAPPPSRRRWYLRAAIIALFLLMGGLLGRLRVELWKADLQLAGAQADKDRVEQAKQDLGRDLADARRLLAAENLRMVSLTDPSSPARGHVLWDPSGNRWEVRVFHLKPPPQGRTYQLWAIRKDNQIIPMPTFTVDATGAGAVTAAVPPGDIAIAAITEEPAAGSPQPTSPPILSGKVQ